MARKQSRRTINNRLDKLWRDVTKQLQPRCEVCGSRDKLNSHHIVGRRNLMTRWDVRNCAVLCVSHHKFGLQSAHEDPLWFDEWLRKNRAEDYEYLNSIRSSTIKRSIDDLLDIEAELKGLKSGG